IVLPIAKEALSRGNIEFIRYELNELLQLFRVNLDPNRPAYRRLALAIIRAEVLALEAVRARNRGEPVESPKLVEPALSSVPQSGCSLRAAYEGWLKTQSSKKST